MTRAPFALLVAAFLAAIAPSPAVAHAQLDRAAPPVGATVKSPPQEISLIFSERVVPGLSSIRLSGLAGPLDTGPIVGDSAGSAAADPAPAAPSRARALSRALDGGVR